jgi:hypothetical protein
MELRQLLRDDARPGAILHCIALPKCLWYKEIEQGMEIAADGILLIGPVFRSTLWP